MNPSRRETDRLESALEILGMILDSEPDGAQLVVALGRDGHPALSVVRPSCDRDRAPTIRDVAEHAGVSIATVSNVLNGGVPVLPETRDRVLCAVASLEFERNAAARQLGSRRTRP